MKDQLDIDAFFEELRAVCREHGMMIVAGPVDGKEPHILRPFSEAGFGDLELSVDLTPVLHPVNSASVAKLLDNIKEKIDPQPKYHVT